ncbi:Crp/Fnr family transcriptional regulator [Emticicia agri]|uniref:Crp/Fnr family transcriptional regulator n=1 Tax=Emticicia agri TaxID=2492393 RepID=A0A4Q5M0B4_9BACT|nr:Crp/Fnr family transcriptional regulator [Emticicia agri]RYU95277.1 Crp/Fnr family transcriptional regulator [Emticicia agri]
MEKLKQQIQILFAISSEEAEIFLSEFKRKELQKNEVFIAEGEICHVVGLIEKGLMVCVYNKDGEEIIDEFGFENGFITNYYSFLTQSPSQKEIRTLEPCIVHTITRQSLEKLGNQYPFIERMSRMMNEKLFLRAHDRIQSLLLESAQERYEKMLAQRPDLAQRIPQYMLASYLHVKPETISRIRRKISKHTLLT